MRHAYSLSLRPRAPNASAQEVSCGDIPLLSRMACVLSQLKVRAGDTYLARLDFASRTNRSHLTDRSSFPV